MMDTYGDCVSPNMKEMYAKAVVDMLPNLRDTKAPKGYVCNYKLFIFQNLIT